MGWFHTVPVGIGLNGQTVNIWNGLCTLANHHCLNTMDQIFGSVDELLSTTQVISFIMAKHKIGKISIWKKNTFILHLIWKCFYHWDTLHICLSLTFKKSWGINIARESSNQCLLCRTHQHHLVDFLGN